jgi:hypothetical protein
MALNNFFNISSLVSLGIIVLIIFIVKYLLNKIEEQSHKITSMFSIISTMAGELQLIKNVTSNQVNINQNKKIVIPDNDSYKGDDEGTVNDDDDDDDGETDDDTDEDTDEDNDFDDEDDDDENTTVDDVDVEEVNLEKNNDNNNEIISHKFSILEDNVEDNNIKVINISDNYNILLSNDENLNIDNENLDINVEKIDNDNEEKPLVIEKDGLDNLKSINIISDNELQDYKKLSASQLKKIVEKKGLSVDTSKLKKNDLLKLLEVN